MAARLATEVAHGTRRELPDTTDIDAEAAEEAEAEAALAGEGGEAREWIDVTDIVQALVRGGGFLLLPAGLVRLRTPRGAFAWRVPPVGAAQADVLLGPDTCRADVDALHAQMLLVRCLTKAGYSEYSSAYSPCLILQVPVWRSRALGTVWNERAHRAS
jgi:hypothetical protein